MGVRELANYFNDDELTSVRRFFFSYTMIVFFRFELRTRLFLPFNLLFR